MIPKKHKLKYCEYCGSYLERYYSVNSAAKICDLSAQFFRNLIRDRKIKYVNFGRSVRIPTSAIKDLMIETPSIDEMYG